MEHDVFLTDDEREETIVERRERERNLTQSGKAENEEYIPLIPNVKADQRKTIVHLEVWKVNPPGDGFKGKVSPTATPEHIAKLYGDGTYDVHAIAADGKTLRRNVGIKVAWVNPDGHEKPAPPLTTPDKEMSLLTWQAAQHEKESVRTEAFGRMVVDTVTGTSRDQAAATERRHEQQITRDREMYSGLITQTQTWAQSMMEQQRQSHQQSMERSEQNFRQSMEVMRMSHERQIQASNPNANLHIFQSAMQWAGSMGLIGDGDEEDDSSSSWVNAIEAAGEAIGDITEAYKFKTKASLVAGAAKTLAEPQQKQNLKPNEKPAESTATQPNEEPARKKKRKAPFTRDDMMGMLEMKAALEEKGIPFSQALRYARANLMGAVNGENGVSQPGSSGGDSQESHEESGNPDVGDG